MKQRQEKQRQRCSRNSETIGLALFGEVLHAAVRLRLPVETVLIWVSGLAKRSSCCLIIGYLHVVQQITTTLRCSVKCMIHPQYNFCLASMVLSPPFAHTTKHKRTRMRDIRAKHNQFEMRFDKHKICTSTIVDLHRFAPDPSAANRCKVLCFLIYSGDYRLQSTAF